MTKREIPLERKAKANIDICCNSLCDSHVVEEYIRVLEERVLELEGELAAIYTEKTAVKNSG